MHIYVASSFRNARYPAVVAALRAEGHTVYDWRDNEGRGGRGIPEDKRNPATVKEFEQTLALPGAVETFESHIWALRNCDAIVLCLPCGRSAHLEFGFVAGRGHGLPRDERARLFVLFEPAVDPIGCDLMYKMADEYCSSIEGLCALLGDQW